MRVVLVDPSRTMRLYVTRLLEAREHEVRACADGPEALACLRGDPEISALITSAELGAMSGLELCWETRVLAGRDRPLYVILMSATIDRSRLGEALDSGADDFISKPPVPDELYARLRAAERFATMQRELVRLASVDALTGLHNRRSFFEHAESARMRCDDGHPLSAIMLDIDHFKRVNDAYGHDVGDQVIAAVARAAGRECALTGRLGGEEYGIVLEGLRTAGAVELAERLRAEVASLRFDTPQGALSLTCSFGVSERHDDESIVALLKRADIALYAAKSGGRNRVVAADVIQNGTHQAFAIPALAS